MSTNRKPRNDQGFGDTCFWVQFNDERRHDGITVLCHLGASTPELDRAMKTISEEIAQVSSAFALTEEEDPLVQTAARLDALRDNPGHIVYSNHTLWN